MCHPTCYSTVRDGCSGNETTSTETDGDIQVRVGDMEEVCAFLILILYHLGTPFN